MPESDFSLAEWAGVNQQGTPPPIVQAEQPKKEFSLKDWAGVSETPKPTGLSEDLAKRAQNIQQLSGEDADLAESKGALVGGQYAGAALDVLGRGISAVTPEFVKKGIGAVMNAPASVPEAGGEEGLSIADHQAEFNRQMDLLKESHPEVYNHIIATGNYAALGTMFVGGPKVGKIGLETAGEVAPIIPKAAGKAAGVVEKRLAGQVADEAINIVREDASKMSPTQLKEARRQGRAQFNYKEMKTEIPVTKYDKELGAAIQDVIEPNVPSQQVNIDNIFKRGIKPEAEAAEKMPKGFDEKGGVFSVSDLDSYVAEAKAKNNILFGKETRVASIEAAYDDVYRQFKELLAARTAKTGTATLSDIFATRKELDAYMKDKFGISAFEKKIMSDADNVRWNAIKDIRLAANEFVIKTLPEGVGDDFKASLKKQNNMYRAVDRITEKMGNEDTISGKRFHRLIQLVKRHPWLSAEAVAYATGKGILSSGVGGPMGGIIGTVLSNPVILTALIGGGTYTIGKQVITSQWLKQNLISFLRASERILKPQEKYQIEKIINDLPPLRQITYESGEQKRLPTGTVPKQIAWQDFQFGAPPSDMMRPPEAMLPMGTAQGTPATAGIPRPENFIPPEYAQRIEKRIVPEKTPPSTQGAFAIRDQEARKLRRINKTFEKFED